MKKFRLFSALVATAALGACASTTPTTSGGPVVPTTTNIGGQATHVGSVYSATQAGTLTAIAGGASLLNGQPFWFNSATNTYISGYESTNALALAGFNAGTPIQGLTGTLTTAALTGTATYLGRYAYNNNTTGSSGSGALTPTANFGAGTITGSAGTAMSVNANITPGAGNQFTGNVIFSIAGSKPLQGGFFGTNELVGTFGDATVAGVIYGTTP